MLLDYRFECIRIAPLPTSVKPPSQNRQRQKSARRHKKHHVGTDQCQSAQLRPDFLALDIGPVIAVALFHQ